MITGFIGVFKWNEDDSRAELKDSRVRLAGNSMVY